jgi:hypothetical protein
MDIKETSLHLSLYTFFLYLANATMCINEEAKDKVWNDMAYKLIEWNDTPRDELRAVFREFGAHFEELCYGCNEKLPIIEEEYEGNALCFECKRVSSDYCEAGCECTHCQRTRPCECGDCEVVGGTCDKQAEEYEEKEKPCICGTNTKNLLCPACEALALDTPVSEFLEVEGVMDKSYDSLYGYPTTAFLQNFGCIEAFRRTSRSSHRLFGEYKKQKIQAYIEKK